MKKLSRKNLSQILGSVNTNGDSSSCWSDSQCSSGKSCLLNDDGNPGQCVGGNGGSGGNGGGGPRGGGGSGCGRPQDCEEQPY
ncbi:hypothetical protein IQ37_14300 [Chryseobacterium piperi]|uniref:Uncharacterized protein n=1 Tax=Chryseobacterium piperi TaxID=558152 RepID=A0A086B2R4_9FLAO|nr:hypothetical protein [Chryseobacterium piperi]ASW76290.1 hypothetical protein CJF12_19765 [Chryseobacterium piperi]KFF23228.1 hypothetical protein IQ37_14300 [Chryseobacterium piperi]